ncbi:MAG: TnpV protein [Clostridiales bacterium]|nr:TnpV protein [Clostridiales bacterium]
MISDEKLLKKANEGKDLTVEEVQRYNEIVKPQQHVYGKYGTLAKIYLEEHNTAKLWGIENLPNYLHGIDKQAEELQATLSDKLSQSEQYKRTGDFVEDYRRLTAMQKVIEEEILAELVYVA